MTKVMELLFPWLPYLTISTIRANYISGNHWEAKNRLPTHPNSVPTTVILGEALSLSSFQEDDGQSVMALHDGFKTAQREIAQEKNKFFGPGETPLNRTHPARHDPCPSFRHLTFTRSSIAPSHDLTKLPTPFNLLIVPEQRVDHQHGTHPHPSEWLRDRLCSTSLHVFSCHIFILHRQSRQPIFGKRPFRIRCHPSSRDCQHSSSQHHPTTYTPVTSDRPHHSTRRRTSSSIRGQSQRPRPN